MFLHAVTLSFLLLSADPPPPPKNKTLIIPERSLHLGILSECQFGSRPGKFDVVLGLIWIPTV